MDLEVMKEKNKELRKRLNKVDDYFPEAELLKVEAVDEVSGESFERIYLPYDRKREWFYLKYPDGRIIPRIVAMTETCIRVEVSVYKDADSHEKNLPIGKSEAFAFFDADDQYYAGKTKDARYTGVYNKAKAKATQDALHNAGFGIQLERNEEISALIDQEMETKLKTILPAPKKPEKAANDTGEKPKRTRRTKAQIEEDRRKEEEAKKQEAAQKEKVVNAGKTLPTDVVEATANIDDFDPDTLFDESLGNTGSSLEDMVPKEPEIIPEAQKESEVVLEAPKGPVKGPKGTFDIESIKKDKLPPESQFPTFGEAIIHQPRYIIWLKDNGANEEIRNKAAFLIENEETVREVASRM
ncbi:hypothetical protein M2146_001061 [Lachnospiraceae bacterium PF1-22]